MTERPWYSSPLNGESSCLAAVHMNTVVLADLTGCQLAALNTRDLLGILQVYMETTFCPRFRPTPAFLPYCWFATPETLHRASQAYAWPSLIKNRIHHPKWLTRQPLQASWC